MTHVTFAAIQPLVTRVEQRDLWIDCTFTCPVTGDVVKGGAPLRRASDRAARDADRRRRSFMQHLHERAWWAARSLSGPSLLCFVKTDSAEAAPAMQLPSGCSEEEWRAVIVRAFETVSDQFVWDPERASWRSGREATQLATDFESQRRIAPLRRGYDQVVLARMLAEVAVADGPASSQVRELISTFTVPGLEPVIALAPRKPLTTIELEAVARSGQCGVGETMLMLAWVIAQADGQPRRGALARLDSFAAALGVPTSRSIVLKRWAQLFLLDRTIEQASAKRLSPHECQREVVRLAERLGLDSTSADRALLQIRRGSAVGAT